MDLRQLERRLKVLANRRRLQILQELRRHRNGTVTAIAKAIHLSLQATSQHLRILAIAGIIRRRKRGLYVVYRLSLRQEPTVKHILRLL